MAYIGEMQYLTIGNNTYSLPTGGGGDGTVTSVGVSNATNGGLSVSGSPITSNGTITIGHSNILSSAQTTQAVYPIKIDKNGHISAYGSAVTIPTKTSDLTNDSGFITSYKDTKNTAGSTNSASKLYLIGATEQSANPQTYSNSNLYYDSINGFYVKSPTYSNSYSCIKQDNYGCTNIYAYSSSDDMPLSTILASSSEVFLGNRSLEMGYNSSISIIDGDIYLSTGANDKHVYIYNLGAPSNDTDAATKKYVDDSVGALTIPTKTSDLTNDSGFITTDEKVKRTTYTSTNPLYPILHTDKTGTSTAYTSDISFYQYYNTAGGYRRLDLGNSTAYKSTGGAYGTIRLYGAAATYYGDLVPGVLGTTSGDGHISANRTWTLPDKTGTVALTSDIPSVYSSTNTGGYLTMSTLPIYNGTVV